MNVLSDTSILFHRSFIIKFFFFLGLAGIISSCAENEPTAETEEEIVFKPEPSRFTQTVVSDGLEEPLQIEFDGQEWVYWIERTGNIKRVHEGSGKVEELGTLPVAGGSAPGLIGFLLDKDFEKTRQLYLYYSAAEDKGEIMRLSRFTFGPDDKIEMNSEVVMLNVPWEQPDGHHFGGGMVLDQEGNLYLSIGGDSAPTQYSPMPFTNEGGKGQDAARTSGNTNDLRGAILRITPQPDGSYTIPEGNLFPVGTPKTRPEIFVMGNRNPWRLSVDSETGYLHWGEVGPDAGIDSERFGPMGYDEFNVAREAGNFGWPFVIGKNLPYNRYNYETGRHMGPFNPEAPVNNSPNSTGLQELPPAQPALIAYPYKVSEEWPVLGSAARSAVGGPIFRRAGFPSDAPGVFPDYYEGKWLVTDYVRNWIMVVTMDEDRTKVLSIEPLLPREQLSHEQPLDMDFSPSGDLYMVEYGKGGKGRISKIEYNAGNRAPVAMASAEPSAGAVPLQLYLSSKGSKDFDEDELTYRWIITPAGGGEEQTYSEPYPEVTLRQPGRYEVVLSVQDPSGATDRDSLKVIAGNERPEVDFEITSGNRSFYFPNEQIEYKVQVRDPEDGSLAGEGIAAEKVSVTAEYIPSGLTYEQLEELQEEGKIRPGTNIRHLKAKELISLNNCMTCHKIDEPLVGPAFLKVAQKYKDDEEVYETLTNRITEGSSGKWEGTIAMPPHPNITKAEAREIINYILDLAASGDGQQSLPVEGQFKTTAHEANGSGGRLNSFFSPPHELGSYLFHASYTDSGKKGEEGLNLTGEDVALLRYPLLAPEAADIFSEEGISFTPSTNDPGFIFTGEGGYIGFKNIDLTGIDQINIGAITRFWHWSHFIGATIELRLDSPTGKLVGEPYQLIPLVTSEGEGPFFKDSWEKPIPIDVSDLEGMHDIYVVVHNNEAERNDALLILTGIEFKQ